VGWSSKKRARSGRVPYAFLIAGYKRWGLVTVAASLSSLSSCSPAPNAASLGIPNVEIQLYSQLVHPTSSFLARVPIDT